LEPLRLAVLAPSTQLISVRWLARELSVRWGIAEVVQSLVTSEVDPPNSAVDVSQSHRWLRCDRPKYDSTVEAKAAEKRHSVRLIEVVLAAIGLVLLAPLLLVLALTIKITSPGPVFLVDQRLGRYGRPCRVYRFRARVSEPEEAALTSVGGFLEETRLERLPQLWNVLRGDFYR
jgi:lipopolysaccharide/colanic/teichoic acid biosynthesis glycosyltransferase